MPPQTPLPELEEALREIERLRAELAAAKVTASVANAACDAFFDAAAQSLRTPLHVLMLQLSSLITGPAAFDVPAQLRGKVASMDRQAADALEQAWSAAASAHRRHGWRSLRGLGAR